MSGAGFYPPPPGLPIPHWPHPAPSPPPPPPPPPGLYQSAAHLPVMPSRGNTYGGGDSWRPQPRGRSPPRQRRQQGYDSIPRRDGNRNSFPPPREDRRSSHTQNYSNDRRDTFAPPQGDFNFRFEKPKGISSQPHDQGRSFQDRRNDNDSSQRHPRQANAHDAHAGRRPRHNGPRSGYNARSKPPFRRVFASDRPILNVNNKNKWQEDLVDSENAAVYKALDELSDSSEAEMDMSDVSGDENASARPAKRVRTANSRAGPQWSNPDPYDALPPVNDSQVKRKDVVQLIRKARVSAANKVGRADAASESETEDFIRCDSDDEDEEGDTYGDNVLRKSDDQDAPVGPRASSAMRVVSYTSKAGETIVIDLTGFDEAVGDPLTRAADAKIKVPLEPALVGVPPSQITSGEQTDTTFTQVSATTTKDISTNRANASELGTRKRTHDDQLKLPQHARIKPVTMSPGHGALSSDWVLPRGSRSSDSCPWVIDDAHLALRPGVRFHKEVQAFYESVRPRLYEERLRKDLIDHLNYALRDGFSGHRLHPFGSYMTALYLPTGDMDLVLCSDTYFRGGPSNSAPRPLMNRFRRLLQKTRAAHRDSVEVISRAKVPLVKYIDNITGLKVDVSFENLGGVHAIKIFNEWKAKYPTMPVLVTIVKQFLMMRGLNEPVNGGIGGFSIICLVVSMLQMTADGEGGKSIAEENLGTMLLHFFNLYGNEFDYKSLAISLNPPRYVDKYDVRTFTYHSQGRLSIIDPNNEANDISGGSSNIGTIVYHFSQAHAALRDRLVEIDKGVKLRSILEVILGGNYKTFQAQRDHMKQVYERRYGGLAPTKVESEWPALSSP